MLNFTVSWWERIYIHVAIITDIMCTHDISINQIAKKRSHHAELQSLAVSVTYWLFMGYAYFVAVWQYECYQIRHDYVKFDELPVTCDKRW